MKMELVAVFCVHIWKEKEGEEKGKKRKHMFNDISTSLEQATFLLRCSLTTADVSTYQAGQSVASNQAIR